ncbi:hypothetical protein MUN81_16825 [Hymenobacter sp. 5317J-9]|uniref:hypothetical protein n=1 Tax=Hymenobacter sp. 5317J-9 TaxID=2932250 RepID=UPI001FD6EE7C|nr:hypothetical protein [Hymenobacter sp. 5317J-9]UOQ96898.1 hypothetical protein MUN81_16825 [Hymenobacter sp. 5317J-9]
MTTEPTEKGQRRYVWPLGINLAILLLLLGLSWPNVTSGGFGLLLLACLNALIGFVFLLFERRRDAGYAGGFFLSFLLLLLIGFGMCSQERESHRRAEVLEAPTNTP